ncbi:MAG: T9SS type A sorting domain-containing protein [Bacteroidia bacterium]|jgi:hypothetical protein
MKHFLATFLLCALWTNVMAQFILFDRHYEFGTWTAGWSIVNLTDSTYIIVGSNDSLLPDGDNYNGIAVKINIYGDTLISKQFVPWDNFDTLLLGPNSDDQFKSIVKTDDNNLLAAGLTQSYGATNYYDLDLFLVKLNYNLDTLWTKAISHPNDTSFRPNQIIPTSDGGYLIGGWLTSYYTVDVRAFLCKVDSVGNLLWYKSYSNLYLTSTIWNMIETTDHGFLCSGSVFNQQYQGVPILFKVDSIGNFQQTVFNFSGMIRSFGANLIATTDSNYVWTSYNPTGINNIYQYRFIKTDATGVIFWDKSFGLFKDGGPTGVLQTPDGGYLMCGGNGLVTGGGLMQGILLKLDANGDSVWARFYGNPSDYAAFWDIEPCADGGYIMCGETYCCNFTPGVGNTSSLWLVKTDSLGLLVTGIEEETIFKNSTLSAFPNPTTTYCAFTTTVPQTNHTGAGKKGASIILFDMRGKQLLEQPLQVGENTVQLSLTNYIAGTYLAVLVIDGYNAARVKVVKQ